MLISELTFHTFGEEASAVQCLSLEGVPKERSLLYMITDTFSPSHWTLNTFLRLYEVYRL